MANLDINSTAPAREAVMYKEHAYAQQWDKRYSGPPSPELDRNWHDLLHKSSRPMPDAYACSLTESKPFT